MISKCIPFFKHYCVFGIIISLVSDMIYTHGFQLMTLFPVLLKNEVGASDEIELQP